MEDRAIKDLIDTLSDWSTPETIFEFEEMISNLSLDGQTICQIIFDSPTSFATLILSHTPKETRGEIARILREEKGWSWARIWDSFREIKRNLKELSRCVKQ